MILIYQMTKVASRSWVEVAHSAAAEPIHVHFIAQKNLVAIANIGAMVALFRRHS